MSFFIIEEPRQNLKSDEQLLVSDITPPITIATINIENVKTNRCYFEHLLARHDILCIQEHWLARFEAHDLSSSHCAAIKCFDDDDPVLPTHKPKGQAGVATLWKKEIDRFITILPDGSPRTQVIQISTTETPITLINTYMPTAGCQDKSIDYSSVLDEVYEITHKYLHSSIVIWLGDINASFNRTNPSANDTLLKTFCEEVGFKQIEETPNCPTYHHFVGDVTSQIDHILQLSAQKKLVSKINILKREHTNVSSHNPVCAVLDVTLDTTANIGNNLNGKQAPIRPKWKKVDAEKYCEITDMKFEALINLINDLPTEIILERMHDIMITSVQEASTGPQRKVQGNKKQIWPPAVIALVQQTKACYAKWKASGCPDKDNNITTEFLLSKKKLRSTQRQILAMQRNDYLQNIMEKCDSGDQQFFSLIKKQRSSKNSTFIKFTENDDEQIDELQGWVDYFSALATPKNECHFDEEYHRKIQFKKLLIESISQEKSSLMEVTENDVKKFISLLKNNKAPDVYGITSEHLKYSSHRVSKLMTLVLNEISKNQQIPEIHKLGVVTPVPKKDKTPSLPDNYRRITVTPTTGKVTEMLIQKQSKPAYTNAQNPLQRGFTEKASSTNTALMLTEVLAESKDKKEPVYVQFLDARKAFDVVWHEGMLCSMHDQGITGPLWNLHASLYDSIKSKVKWKGQISNELIDDEQGLRQGGLTSADSFKTKENPLLNKIEDSPDAFHIGAINVGAPTCADDVALCSKTLTGAKILNNIAIKDSCSQRYTYSSTKSKVMIGNPNNLSRLQLELFPISLLHETLEETVSEVHLGIHRNPRNKASPTVLARIKTARRAAYAMMGAGLHGLNGLNPSVSMKLIETYILPRLLYGLDAMITSDTDISSIEKYYRTLLRQIQHLPTNTANEAIYLLVGALPVEAHLDIRILSLFNRVASLKHSKEWEIVRRQLAMKDMTSHSWVVHVRKILSKYSLPSAFEMFHNPMKKEEFKMKIKEHIRSLWEKKLQDGCKEKSSLKYLNLSVCAIGTPHPIYSMKNTDPIYVHMNVIRAKLLTLRYNLAASHVTNSTSGMCPMCLSKPETISHFLFECEPMACRSTLGHMLKILDDVGVSYPGLAIESYDYYTRLLLDPTFLGLSDETINELNIISTRYVFSHHNNRAVAAGTSSGYVMARKYKSKG